MDLGTELGKNRSCYLKSTNGNVKGQNEERKEEVLEVKLAIKKKATRKRRRRRTFGKVRTYRQ
jgi:hypothetical protein